MAGKLGTRLRREIGIVEGHADVWRLFDDPELLRTVAAALVDPFRGEAAKVAGIESRGFIIGTAAALELDVGFVPIRKAEGLFPGPKAVVDTESDYRDRIVRLRLQRSALDPGDRVLLVDDWVETGSQARGAKRLIEECDAQLVGVATVVTQVDPENLTDVGRLHSLVDSAQLDWA
jgi:adenine phosphoribosyltransferase